MKPLIPKEAVAKRRFVEAALQGRRGFCGAAIRGYRGEGVLGMHYRDGKVEAAAQRPWTQARGVRG